MPEVANFLFPLKDGVLWLDFPRGLIFEAKVKSFVMIVAVTEGTRIVFSMLSY